MWWLAARAAKVATAAPPRQPAPTVGRKATLPAKRRRIELRATARQRRRRRWRASKRSDCRFSGNWSSFRPTLAAAQVQEAPLGLPRKVPWNTVGPIVQESIVRLASRRLVHPSGEVVAAAVVAAADRTAATPDGAVAASLPGPASRAVQADGPEQTNGGALGEAVQPLALDAVVGDAGRDRGQVLPVAC